VFEYVVVFSAILEERNQPLDVRLANAEWIKQTEDERVTLITCWPYESNTHRVVVVAVPVRTAGSG
jgi:sortase A